MGSLFGTEFFASGVADPKTDANMHKSGISAYVNQRQTNGADSDLHYNNYDWSVGAKADFEMKAAIAEAGGEKKLKKTKIVDSAEDAGTLGFLETYSSSEQS